jgi:nicotinamide-nucleotide amidase
MKAEIIAVGSELLTPDHLDTNSLYLTEKLWEVGYRVQLKTVVGDDAQDIAAILRSALSRSDLILITGGLGPTEDDLTRGAVAATLNRSISVDTNTLEALRQRFASRGYQMAKINERQAEVIAGAEVLSNSFGTAPGMWLVEGGVGIALLPGPPREIKPMLESQLLPRLRQLGEGKLLARKFFVVAGMTESEVDSRVAPIYTMYPKIQTIILSSPAGITLKLLQWMDKGEDSQALEELASRILEVLGDAVYTSTGESMEEVIGRLLSESGLTLAVAESCTAGLIGWRITRVPGSSNYFLGGVLCYSNDVKTKLCGVPQRVLERHGAVSAEAAEDLASGVRKKLGSSIGLSVTGIAGPAGGSTEKPVGLVYVGLADADRIHHERRILPGDRDTIRERSAYFALSCLRKFIMRR